MNPLPRSKNASFLFGKVFAAVVFSLATLANSGTRGATLTWGGGESGQWDLAAAIWYPGPVAWTQTGTASPTNDAVFADGDESHAIALATPIAVNNISFTNSGYTLSGSTLYLGPSGSISVAPGKVATISAKISAADCSSLTFTVERGGVLNLAGELSNNGQNGGRMKVSGAGEFGVSGGVFTLSVPVFNCALIKQTGGVVSLAGNGSGLHGNHIGYDAGRNVTYLISGGTLSLQGPLGNNGYLTICRDQGNCSATLTVRDGGTVNIGTKATGRLVLVGAASTGTGVLDIQGGNLTVGTADPVNQIYFFSSGCSAPTNAAIMQQSGGTVTTQGIQFGGTKGTYVPLTTGTVRLEMSGGKLFVGRLGITKGSAAAALKPSILLSSGTVGAVADWSSTLAMTLTGTGRNAVTFLSADGVSNPRHISLSGELSGAGGLIKKGPGILTLSGVNTYSGGTVIEGGTLMVTTTAGSAVGTGPVMVQSGATLSGAGVVGGNVTLEGCISPGIASSGTLTINGDLSVNGPGRLRYEVASANGLVAVEGNVKLGGTVNVSNPGGLTSGTYRLIKYTGTLANDGLSIGSMPPGDLNYRIDTSLPGQVNLIVGPSRAAAPPL